MIFDGLVILAAGWVVAAAGLYFIALGVLCFLRPEATSRFLSAFASTARVHFLELSLRILVGVALVIVAAEMNFAELFRGFGGLLVGTTVVLAMVPWRLHRRFASWVTPSVLRVLGLFGLASLGLGLFLLCSLAPLFWGFGS